jgi:hydroxyacylglutathione hydrolase
MQLDSPAKLIPSLATRDVFTIEEKKMPKTKGLVPFKSASPIPAIPGAKDVIPQEVWELRDSVHLIDVRSPGEFESGHAPGAKLFTLDALPQEINKLPKDETVVFICRSGGRSMNATAFAASQGFKNIYNMKGGMLLWTSLGLKIDYV